LGLIGCSYWIAEKNPYWPTYNYIGREAGILTLAFATFSPLFSDLHGTLVDIDDFYALTSFNRN
jgi:hypothetical protein